MMTPIALQLENRDVMAAQRLYQRSSTWRRRILVRVGIAIPVLTLATVLLVQRRLDWRDWASLTLGGLIGMAVLLLILPRLVGWLAGRRALERQPILRREQALHWDDDGFRQFEDTGRDGHYRWTDVIELAHDPQTILLFISPRLFVVVPRRALSPDQSADLIAMAAAKGVPVWPRA